MAKIACISFAPSTRQADSELSAELASAKQDLLSAALTVIADEDRGAAHVDPPPGGPACMPRYHLLRKLRLRSQCMQCLQQSWRRVEKSFRSVWKSQRVHTP